jgi:hypothetical protein
MNGAEGREEFRRGLMMKATKGQGVFSPTLTLTPTPT